MSYYFRERPRFGERFRGKSGDELLEELKQQLDEEDRPFFETGKQQAKGSTRTRDPFERHTSFPRGFPFDDEGFGRRADIRTHLDDLAARHPEFADHLLGPPWADVPFPGGGGSLHRNRNRRASTDRPSNPAYQPDDDARSATSGGSGVSSHSSEPDTNEQQQQYQPKSQGGLRNHTLDIGQHQHNMENPQQQRNVRSMSAPPENRNNQGEPGQPRFVSRVDITPQSQEKSGGQQTQPQQNDKPQGPQQKPQAQPQSQSQQAGNVRHIPIFVEGRDEPVITKGPAATNTTTNTNNNIPPHNNSHHNTNIDEPDFPRRQQSPPHFHRPSHFSQQHFNKHTPPGWPHFQQDPFFEHPTREWPSRQRHQSPFSSFRQTAQPDKSWTQQTHHQEQPPPQQTQRPQKPQQQTPHNQQHHQETEHEAPPKPRQQVQPKDPLEKVALVQKEVDALAEQVRQFTGNSRQDKQYMYLDEMLTRELIKLDDIDTEGKENVRQTRKQAIKSIQDTISLLESKAPLPGQQQQTQPEEQTQQMVDDKPAQNGVGDKPTEAMDTTEAPVTEEQKAIPLPPPSSPTKVAPQETQPLETNASKTEEQKQPQQPSENAADPQALPQAQAELAASEAANLPQEPQKDQETKPSEEPMESSSNSPVPPQQVDQEKMEVRQSSPVKELPPSIGVEPPKNETLTPAQQEATDAKPEEQKKEQPPVAPEVKDVKTEKPKKEPPPVPAKPNKSPKKAKKTPKKQPEPISETAIPMPAPGH